MAAVTSRAPRVFAKHTSMSAAALRYTTPDHNFPAAWQQIWTACGGKFYEADGQCTTAMPAVDELSAQSLPAIGFHLDTVDQQRGALTALSAVAFLAGPGALRAVVANEGHDPVPDSAIETSWDLFKVAAVTLLNTDLRPGDESVLDEQIIAAENEILNATPQTLRGTIIQLWTGLYQDPGNLPAPDFHYPGSPGVRTVERAILAEDFAKLDEWERAGLFDWSVRFLVRALVSLSRVEA